MGTEEDSSWGKPELTPDKLTNLAHAFLVSELVIDRSVDKTANLILNEIVNRARTLDRQRGFPMEEVLIDGKPTLVKAIRVGVFVRGMLNIEAYITPSQGLMYCRTRADKAGVPLDLDTSFSPKDTPPLKRVLEYTPEEIIAINHRATAALKKAREDFERKEHLPTNS